MKKIDKKMYSPNGGAKGVELADSASPVEGKRFTVCWILYFEADIMKKGG